MYGRQRMGTDAVAKFQSKAVIFDVDMPVGTFFSLKPTDSNKGVVADKTLVYPAVGFIEQGSSEEFGEAFEDEPNRPLRAGEVQKVYLTGELNLGVDTFTDAQVAGRVPVYEGTAGAYTLVKTSTTGQRVRVLGFVKDKRTIWVDFTIDPVGTIV
jgi:hypothetical protein